MTPHFIDQIKASDPNLEIETIDSSLSGRFNQIVLINGEIVFRFPKYRWVAAKIPETFRTLRALSGFVTLPTPYPTAMRYEPGCAFLRYKALGGKPLWLDTVRSVDNIVMERLAIQLGTFLHGLHQLTPSVLALENDFNLDSHEHWTEVYRKIKKRLFPAMGADGRATVRRHFETHLDDASRFTYTPTFRHGDPGPGNVLFDQVAGRLSAIIDFDFAGFGDPAVDWSIVREPVLYGESFVSRLISLFPLDDALLARAGFYRGNWIVNEALRALDAGEHEAFEREMTVYQ